MKVVVFSHGHPVFSKGGGELAAYYLWTGLNRHPECEAWFIGRTRPDAVHKFSSLALMGERDYIVGGHATIADLTSTLPLDATSDLAELLASIQPDVVHFHHYVHLGVDLIRLVKNICPQAKIFLTLHEFIAICANNGQMIKPDGKLCYRYSPRECNVCFPHIRVEDFFLRERYIKSFFGLVDRFVSPSWFLRDRYIAWGLDGSRIDVIENGLPEADRIPPRPLYGDEIRGRFAYFGQINPYKGLDVVLAAFASLPTKLRKKVSLDIFGSGLEDWTLEFQEKIKSLLAACADVAHLHGPYEPEEMGRLIREVDWVVMGSVWWENSPLVIQEAYKFGRPVICPDIGGMAEKVKPGEGGLNYRARDSVSLASQIKRIIEEPQLFDTLHQALPDYPSIAAVTGRHLEAYQTVRG